MRFLRSALATIGLLMPAVVATFLAYMLYNLHWAMCAVVFLLVLSLCAEGVRALRRLD